MSYAGTFSFTVLGMSGVLESEGGSSISLSCTEEGGGGCTDPPEYYFSTMGTTISPDPDDYSASLCYGSGVPDPPLPTFVFSCSWELVETTCGIVTGTESGVATCNVDIGDLPVSELSCVATAMTSQGEYEIIASYIVSCA